MKDDAVMMQQSLNKLTGQVEWNVVRLHDHGTALGPIFVNIFNTPDEF